MTRFKLPLVRAQSAEKKGAPRVWPILKNENDVEPWRIEDIDSEYEIFERHISCSISFQDNKTFNLYYPKQDLLN